MPTTHPPPAVCPACDGARLRSFYETPAIPVHSVLLMASSAKAVTFPRRDLRLAVCEGCGFIFNELFDPATNAYSAEYEETQHFSDTFNQFARRLAATIIDRYALREQLILEIGCGKGEFLALLCELGENHGVGIDPACRPERLPAAAAARVRLAPGLYGPQHAREPADFVVCRHTLEHVGPVRDFLQLLRRSKAVGDGAPVLIEVPDTTRVLRDRAFWDIYYEHAAYFTRGSLARLATRCGFEVLEMHRDYGDQYLWAVLRASDAAETATQQASENDDLAETLALAADFERAAPREIATWRERIAAWHARAESAVLWGAGSKAVAFVTTLDLADEIAGAVDINPHKQGRYLPGSGHRVFGPDELPALAPRHVIAMNGLYQPEIAAQLRALHVPAELHSVDAH